MLPANLNGDVHSSTARPPPSQQAYAYKSSSHPRLDIRSDNGSRTGFCEAILMNVVRRPDRITIPAPGIASTLRLPRQSNLANQPLRTAGVQVYSVATAR